MTAIPPPAKTFREHVVRTFRLAWPVALARMGLVMLTTADVIVLGRAGEEELADFTLGLAIYDSLLAVLAGLLMGVGVLTARETGAGRDIAAGGIWRRGLLYGAAVGVALTLLLQLAGPLYAVLGQAPERIEGAAVVTRIVALALPFVAIYFCTTSFLEALHKPYIGMIAVGLANVSNLGLDILLVFGAGPVPALGAQGAAISTVLNAGLLAGGLWFYTRHVMGGRRQWGIGRRDAVLPRAAEQLRIGLAAGLSYGFEAGAFVAMTLFVGLLGTLALASHAVLFQLLATTFMLALGIAAATQVRVGNAWGRGDAKGVAMAGWTGLLLATASSGAFALFYVAFPDLTLALFTDKPTITAAALPVMVWMILALIFDGNQTVMSHACRGRGDTWVPTVMHLGSYWVVMVPSAYIFSFTLEQGLAGVYQGIFVASVVSVTVMSLRFRHVAAQVALAPAS